MPTDVLQYLNEKGLFPKRASSDEVHIACLWCGESIEKRGRLYVNINPDADILGLNHCKLCDHRGSLVTLQRFFGDATEAQEKEDTGHLRRAILAQAAEFYYDNLTPEALDWLTDVRGLTMKTIRDHQIGYANGGLFRQLRVSGYAIEDIASTGLVTVERGSGRTVDFFTNHVTIPYHTAGNVVMIRGRDRDDAGVEAGRKYLTGPGQKTRLFNTDATWGADELVITEGEFDCLILEQEGFHAVACPGAGVWQDAWDGYFDEAKRVWVVFDRDEREHGQKGARKVIEHLGSKARRVELPPHELGKSKNDITEYFVVQHKTVADFTLLIRSSSQYLISVVEAIAEHADLQSQVGVKFGLMLDKQMLPGLLGSQVMVYLAKTGCIQGDAEISLNRAGKGFRMPLKDVVHRFNGGRIWGGKYWDPTIPTLVQREEDGQVRLGRLLKAWSSGVKTTYTVTTNTGRQIRATDEHPFLTERGWLRLDELVVGDRVHVRGHQGSTGSISRPGYARRTVPLHPHAGRRSVKAGGHSVPLHRLIAEAVLNGMRLEQFLERCRIGPIKGLSFLDPDVWVVHHRDHDSWNNAESNLRVVTHQQHKQIHAAEGTSRNVAINIDTEAIVSVELYGEEETYDLEVEDDPHNFVANGFVVHNSGKTIWLLNLFQRLCALDKNAKVLFVSLEQTRGDWWERARRIYRFYNLGATDAEAAAWWTDRIWIDDRNRVGPDDLYELIEDFKYQTGDLPTIVAVDYLGYWAQSFKGERYERTSDAIMSMKAIAKDLRVPIITPHQVSRMTMHGSEPSIEAARDSGVVEETADFVMSLWSPDTVAQKLQEDHSGEFNVKIAKSRHGGVGFVERFYFAPLCLAIVPTTDTRRVSLAQHELRYRTVYADNWEQALVRHESGVDFRVEKITTAQAAVDKKRADQRKREGLARQGVLMP